MMEIKYLKTSLILLTAIIPLSVIGYLFAVYEESLFFLYEWSLGIIIIALVIFSGMSVIQTKGNLKWISISLLAFLIHFSVLGLFLGPFTSSSLFLPFYVISILALAIYVNTFKKIEKYKFIPAAFSFFSVLFLAYMLLLNVLWGQDLSFIQWINESI